MADLDSNVPLSGGGDDRQSVVDGGGEGLLHQDGDSAVDRGQGQRHVRGRGGGDDHTVQVGLPDHLEGIRESPCPRGAGRGLERSGIRVGDGGQDRLGMIRDDAEVVPAHGAQADQAEPEG